MNKNDKSQFESDYQQHLKCLKLQGKANKTIEAYSHAIRRVSQYFDCLPEDLTPDNLKDYFAALVDSHSWSTVKIDRLGLQFYWRHVLKKDWRWVDIVKPPKVKTLPDILTPSEIERLLSATRKLRYRVFLLTTYSMGLQAIIQQYKPDFIKKYGNSLLPSQWLAIHAMQRCRTPHSGELYLQCTPI